MELNYLNLDEIDIWFITNNQQDLKNYKKLKECVLYSADFNVFEQKSAIYNYLINNKINNNKLINNLIHQKYQLIINLIDIINDFRHIFNTHKLTKITVFFKGIIFTQFQADIICRGANCRIMPTNHKCLDARIDDVAVYCDIKSLVTKAKLPELHAQFDAVNTKIANLKAQLTNEHYLKNGSARLNKKRLALEELACQKKHLLYLIDLIEDLSE